MNEEIVSRINELIEDSLLAQSAFAHEVGLDPANFGKKLKGIQPITKRDISMICESLCVSQEWLTTGAGEKYISARNDAISLKIKNDIVELARKLSQNKELIIKLDRENEDIMRQLSALYMQLDKY